MIGIKFSVSHFVHTCVYYSMASVRQSCLHLPKPVPPPHQRRLARVLGPYCHEEGGMLASFLAARCSSSIGPQSTKTSSLWSKYAKVRDFSWQKRDVLFTRWFANAYSANATSYDGSEREGEGKGEEEGEGVRGSNLNISPGKQAVLEFMKRQGVNIDLVQDITLPENVEIMMERFEFLRVLGLSASELINEFPPLAGCSVSKNFIPVLEYLEKIPIGRASLPKVIQKYPRVLYFSVKIDMEPIIDYLLGMGVMPKNLEKMLVRYPQILGFRLEGTMSTSVSFLVSLGIDIRSISDIITSEPEILGMRVGNNLLPKAKFFQSLGISKQSLASMIKRHPFVLQFPAEPQMENTVAELVEMGVTREDIGDIVCRFPDVLGLPVREKSTQVREWLTRKLGFNTNQFPKLVKKLPQVLVINQQKADQKIDYFLNYGFSLDQVGSIVLKCPQLLGSNVSEKIRPRLDFLVQDGGREFDDIVEYPDCLLCSVDFLKARLSAAEGGNRRSSQVKSSLKWLLDCSDEKFRERMEVGFNEGPKRSPEFFEGPVVISSSKNDRRLVNTEKVRQVKTNVAAGGRGRRQRPFS